MFTGKVLRTCPRCHKRLYHFLALRKDVMQSRIVARCADCGHEWKVRLKPDEK